MPGPTAQAQARDALNKPMEVPTWRRRWGAVGCEVASCLACDGTSRNVAYETCRHALHDGRLEGGEVDGRCNAHQEAQGKGACDKTGWQTEDVQEAKQSCNAALDEERYRDHLKRREVAQEQRRRVGETHDSSRMRREDQAVDITRHAARCRLTRIEGVKHCHVRARHEL